MKKLIVILLFCISGFLLLFPASAEETSPRLVLSETEIRLAVGKNTTLKASVENFPSGRKGKAAWATSDPAVCTVSAAGAVKAISEGTAVITCTVELTEGETLSAECKVTTFVTAKKLKAVNKEIRLNVGETASGEVEIQPEDTTEKTLDWMSSDENVVTVDAGGIMTAAAPGKARITAKTKDGSGLKADFTVYVPTLAVSETEYTISNLNGLTIPLTYYGDDFENNITVKVTGKPVIQTTRRENNKIELHLDALEAGDSRIEISDKKDSKAKTTLKVHTEEAAITDNVLLEITSFSFRKEENTYSTRLTGRNHASQPIVFVVYAMDLYNSSGEQVFMANVEEGADLPTAEHYLYSKVRFNPHAEGSDSINIGLDDVSISDSDVAEIRCAVASIIFKDGTRMVLPGSQYYWFSSVSGYSAKPEGRAHYESPSEEEIKMARAVTVNSGFYYAAVDEFLKSWYAVPAAGEYVHYLEPDSLAEKCGLRLKDLIVEVDGIRYLDDPYLVDRGMAKMAEGETVIFKVLRDGEVVELEFHQ